MKSAFVKFRLNPIKGVQSYGPPLRKQLAIPDQSLSIKEILNRYVRGVPVDVRHREPVYVDQSEFDLEQLSRMEFSDKMSIAERLRAEYDAKVADLEAKASARSQAKKEAQGASNKANEAPADTQKEPGEGSKA